MHVRTDNHVNIVITRAADRLSGSKEIFWIKNTLLLNYNSTKLYVIKTITVNISGH